MATMIKAGIIGGAGYTAGELLRILIYHPGVEITFVHSNSQSGKPISTIHNDLIGLTALKFGSELQEVDILFLCQGHGHSRSFLEKNHIDSATKIIDLSTDFRHEKEAHLGKRQFVYGLPELNKQKIQAADNVANPGCFATTIQLAILPLAKANLLQDALHVHAITGSTGAGQEPGPTSHFSWRNNNISIYKAFEHQHLTEITESVRKLQGDFNHDINFIPMRGNFTRGIFASVYTLFDGTATDVLAMYEDFYKDAPFVQVTNQGIHLKQVVNTNNCFVNIEKHGNKVLITSTLDNLLKGASGQAVENLNLMYNLNQTTGLQLKAGAF